MKEEFTEPFDAVAFPVFHQGFELFNSFDTLFASDGIVGAGKYR